MAIDNISFQDVQSIDDMESFLDEYRGSGIGDILKRQFLEISEQDDAHAFSALGNFLDLLIHYHKNESVSKEIKDDYMYIEIRDLLAEMKNNPEYLEYADYLDDKIEEMKAADLLKNQEVD